MNLPDRLRADDAWPADLLPRLGRFRAGTGHDCWQVLGAHPVCGAAGGVRGFRFAVWAPAALQVHAIGEFDVAASGAWGPGVALVRGAPGVTDGIWFGFTANAQPGQLYKFKVTTADDAGQIVEIDRADPFARSAEKRPGTASRLVAERPFAWRDGAHLRGRAKTQGRTAPVSIYELHLGSWRHANGRAQTYRELAGPLVAHVQRLGFTHVELLPLTEHPYDPSWGYQCTGFFAPTSRYFDPTAPERGPDDLRHLVAELHAAGIHVWMDWVPAHFAVDGHALVRFDGTPLFEAGSWTGPDRLVAAQPPGWERHPDWGTFVFDHGKPEVRSFLLASAAYWLEMFHLDGLRVDAVASMLYLDYSRQPGQWAKNVHGGEWNLDAMTLLQDLNRMVGREFPGVARFAEESTTFPGVTQGPPPAGTPPSQVGQLGFTYKWNFGWMHDTLAYLRTPPLQRPGAHDRLAFPFGFCTDEAFVLPLSHDEVVHGKGTVWNKPGTPPGLTLVEEAHDRQRQATLLFGLQWLHPGKKLLFMGQEFGQLREWNQDCELDWWLADDPPRIQLMAWLAALNGLYRTRPELHAVDCEPGGFAWVDGTDRDRSVLVWSRRAGRRELVCVVQCTPARYPEHWLPLPKAGTWRCVLTNALAAYGGDETALPGPVRTFPRGGRVGAEVALAPYAVQVWERSGK